MNSVSEDTQWTCATCGAIFRRPYEHCAVCGRHYLKGAAHECEGFVDWEARRERASAYLKVRTLKRIQYGTDERGRALEKWVETSAYDY